MNHSSTVNHHSAELTTSVLINNNNEQQEQQQEHEEQEISQSNELVKQEESFQNTSQSFWQRTSEDGDKLSETITLTGFDGKPFEVTFLVSNHLSTTSGAAGLNKKKEYFCLSCPYRTTNVTGFKQHLAQHQHREGYAKCRYCPYYVSLVRLLKQHEVLHPEFEARLTARELKGETKQILNC